MNKKITVFLAVILSLAASVSFAAVLSDYGTITGTATNVLPPTFYIGSVDNETLSINNKPSNCNSFGITNTHRTFKTTKDLGGVSFNYLPKINFQVRAEGTPIIITTTTTIPIASTTSTITTSTTSTIFPSLTLRFGYYDTSDVEEVHPHYLGTTTISLTGNMTNYPLSPVSPVECSSRPVKVKKFFYEFTKICPSDDPSCSVSIGKCDGDGFYTKVKLSK